MGALVITASAPALPANGIGMTANHDFPNTKATAIETSYAGHLFRSRLEARWAVFFNFMGIPWLYEPEGFFVDGRPYLPDFYLPECGIWIEVKGNPVGLDMDLMNHAAQELPIISELHPQVKNLIATSNFEVVPRLMIVGNMPTPVATGDYGWVGIFSDGMYYQPVIDQYRFGFGNYFDEHSPDLIYSEGSCLVTAVHSNLANVSNAAQLGYAAARSARFEHGYSGAML
jgi:hypothetical protein